MQIRRIQKQIENNFHTQNLHRTQNLTPIILDNNELRMVNACITTAREFKNTRNVIYHDLNCRVYRVRIHKTQVENGKPVDDDTAEKYLWLDFHVTRELGKVKKPGNKQLRISTFASGSGNLVLKGSIPYVEETITFYTYNVRRDDTITPRYFIGRVQSVDVGIARIYKDNVCYMRSDESDSFGCIKIRVLSKNINRSLTRLPEIPSRRNLYGNDISKNNEDIEGHEMDD